MDVQDDKAVWNAWYPIGSPVDIRRQGMRRTRLLGRDIEVTIQQTHMAARCDGKVLPVMERLGYAWVTLGSPSGAPPSLVEYNEFDRVTLNVWSAPIKCSGLRIVDNVIDNAHFPFVHAGILGDEEHLELAPYENYVDRDGTLWSTSHQAWLPLTKSIAIYTYRIADPFSVILYIHRPTDAGEVQRYDYLGIFVQPTDETNSIAHKMLAWVKEDWMNPRELRRDQQWISAQDKFVLERHNPKELPLGVGIEQSVSVDSASLAYRKWLSERCVRYGTIQPADCHATA